MIYNRINRYLSAISLIFLIQFSLVAQKTYEGTQEGGDQSGFHWPEGKRMAISLTFDDARPSQVDVGVPILNKYDVDATFYVSPGWMEERLDAWKGAIGEGHEIGNHTLTHPCTGNFPWARDKALETFTLRDIAGEMEQANRVIQEKLGVTLFLLPFLADKNLWEGEVPCRVMCLL
jgi:peptidoglycan-N-acetylglucosamine deacetylase